MTFSKLRLFPRTNWSPYNGSMKMLLSGILAVALLGSAPTPAPIIANNFPVAATTRDGSKDWAFEYGTWRTHYRLLVRRLAHSHTWYDCYGTSIVTPFWGGEGNLEDGDLKCPHRYIGGMALRMYNPRTRQWTIWWGTRRLAVSPPAQVGHFENTGVGRFYSYDNWQGTPIITRFQWSVPHGNPRFEQAFSTDGGKTWETNWTTDYTRVSSATPGVWNRPDKAQGVHGGFAFLAGTWNLHIKRLAHPLSGREDWVSCSGPSTDHQILGRRRRLPRSANHVRRADDQRVDAASVLCRIGQMAVILGHPSQWSRNGTSDRRHARCTRQR